MWDALKVTDLMTSLNASNYLILNLFGYLNFLYTVQSQTETMSTKSNVGIQILIIYYAQSHKKNRVMSIIGPRMDYIQS